MKEWIDLGDSDLDTEVSRNYTGTTTAFCRRCRETEIFDYYLVTTKHEISGDLEAQHIRVCQGCDFEELRRGFL